MEQSYPNESQYGRTDACLRCLLNLSRHRTYAGDGEQIAVLAAVVLCSSFSFRVEQNPIFYHHENKRNVYFRPVQYVKYQARHWPAVIVTVKFVIIIHVQKRRVCLNAIHSREGFHSPFLFLLVNCRLIVQSYSVYCPKHNQVRKQSIRVFLRSSRMI